MKHKIVIKISFLMAFLFVVTFGTTLSAQIKTPAYIGVVHDEFGKPLEGVLVKSENGKDCAYTNIKGEYSLAVTDENPSLEFNYLGYASQKVTPSVTGKDEINLKIDASNKDEVVYLGFSNEKRGQLTGSVSTVTGEELQKSPVANFSMALAGRLPGLATKENSSELGRASTGFYVRGQANYPLAVIDGIPTNYNIVDALDYLNANEIESVTVLKDASTEALYGIEGANGVVVITTKKGHQGKLKIHARFDESLQQVTTKPTFINSAEYCKLRNEATANDGGSPIYSDQTIANYQAGTDPKLYPNTNWYNMFMKNYAQMQRVNVDLQGGGDRIQYFTDLNIMNQGSQFNVDQKVYNSNEHFLWINFRSNVIAKINKYLSATLNLAGNIKDENSPGSLVFSQGVYNQLFTIPSNVYGPTTPLVTDPTTNLTTGNQVIVTNKSDSPYGTLNRSGYTNDVVTNIYAHFGLDLDMSWLTKGLKASGVYAYQTNSVDILTNTQDYERYVGSTDTGVLTFTKKGTNINSDLARGKSSSYYYNLTYKGTLNYDRDFGLSHISGMGFAFFQQLHHVNEVLSYMRLHTGLEAIYSYDQKYILKADYGYSGSEAYGPGNRFTATPAVSAAWVISRESFLKDQTWLTNLKLKASYGVTAQDLGIGRFVYLDNDTWTGGGLISALQYTTNEGQVANPLIQPEKIEKQNYGIDLGLFNNLALGIDFFSDRMGNMLINPISTVPTYQGVVLSNYPRTNAGIHRYWGTDFTANYSKTLSKDLSVNLGGFVSYAKNKIIYSAESEKAADYAYRYQQQGFPTSQSFGYLVNYSNGNGFFNSQDEIANSGLTYNGVAPRVGDLIYQDLNKDGKIDSKDVAPLGNGVTPQYYFGISGGLTYKAFDISVLFQGLTGYKTVEGGIGTYGTDYDGVYGSLLENAYTTARYQSGAKITSPALSLNTTSSMQSSDYYLYDRSYIRLKNLEIGYTLPSQISHAISADKIRLILSAQNLFTWDKMKSSDFGPEGSYLSIPVYKVLNVGLSLLF